ncbi:Metalloprotease StcE [Aeromonas salmonicida]
MAMTASGSGDCQLQVETRDGLLRFRLANHRLSASVMNKFHVNVPTASEPRSASVLCRNQVQSDALLTPAPAGLGYTVNGMPLTR